MVYQALSMANIFYFECMIQVRFRYFVVHLFLAFILNMPVLGQSLSREQIVTSASGNLTKSIKTLTDFLAIPNNGRQPEQIQQNLEWCKRTFEGLGFKTEVLHSKQVPHLLATLQVSRKLPTILFYLQIDGQPVDVTKWDQPNPYQAVFKRPDGDGFVKIENPREIEGDNHIRIFARSVSDSKGPAMAFISALTILKEKKISPGFNIKVIMDFQEELGSPALPALVESSRDHFEADAILIMDGTRHVSNLPTLTYGARGIATITLKVYGPDADLHSGQYGNYAPNPVFGLSKILAGMKDDSGRVIVPGFYDGITITDQMRSQLKIEQEDEMTLMRELGIARHDEVGSFYQEALQFPSLNVRGLRAAWVGNEVRTIIPSEAIAEIDMRLVPETPADRQINLVRTYIENLGYHLVDKEPTMDERLKFSKLASFTYRIGSKPFRTDINSPLGKWLGACMEHIFDDQFVNMQMTGGSQPIEPFIATLNIPAVSVRIPNPDNNIHAPNENLSIGNYLEGIEMCLSILTHRYP